MGSIGAHAAEPLAYDELIEEILQAIPETKITKLDYYDDRWQNSIALGFSPESAPMRCLKRVGEEHGTQREIQVPLGSGRLLSGRIDKMGALFTGADFHENEVATLINVLHHFNLNVEVHY
jgi:hypothetical protein